MTDSREGITATILQSPDFDLDSGFVRGALSDSLKQSLSLIEKAETLPSCSKFATSALFHSCQSLEGSITHDSPLPAGSDLLIEEESGIYAARLAVCELQGADFVVPTACRSFIPIQDHKRKRMVRGWLTAASPSKPMTVHEFYDDVTEANLKQCRQALGSSSQAWTSYSNNRQNAVAMCHAMQSAVEQDESRHIAKILTHTAAATSESLQEAYEQVNEIKRQFHELRTAMPKFQQDLASFDGGLQQRVQDYWDQLANARSGLESLTVAIDRSQEGMQEIHTHLHAAVKDLIPELVLEIARAKQQASDTAETAAASSELVAYAVQKTEQNLIARLDTAGHGLAAINELMPELRGHIEMTLSNSVSFLEAAKAQQYEFIAAQNRTMEGLERMQQTAEDANSKLDGFVSTLASVKDLVDELEPYFGPILPFVAFVFDRFKILGAATFFGLCSLVFWHEHVQYSWGGSSVAAIASTIGEPCLLAQCFGTLLTRIQSAQLR